MKCRSCDMEYDIAPLEPSRMALEGYCSLCEEIIMELVREMGDRDDDEESID